MEDYVNKTAHWVIQRPEGAVYIPITIIDAKEAFGRIRVLADVAGTGQQTWLDTQSVHFEKETQS